MAMVISERSLHRAPFEKPTPALADQETDFPLDEFAAAVCYERLRIVKR